MIKHHFVGLLTHTFRGGDPSDLFSAFPEYSSDRFSPKEKISAHTAAVPSRIHTRLSCSACPVFTPGMPRNGFMSLSKMIILPVSRDVKGKLSRLEFPEIMFSNCRRRGHHDSALYWQAVRQAPIHNPETKRLPRWGARKISSRKTGRGSRTAGQNSTGTATGKWNCRRNR